ncbi:MAG: M42 family metallopeptidase [Spiroplasma poulsonii]|uniref:M42 family peptidase n=1 Tax=Spiroplasma poulsonii TaxID=2138 RepID=A0A2P6FAK4_9MOLU|nr:M42 family metallopeptidase [Spiroplasma poulsonii]KAF0851887.1 putative aminopeptidase YsdC [Spiroplasma poulsonii]MBW1242472.1 M42 family metallopeptidase [Spiroplasma poulsonii]MBW3057884.1 M42 family peptidase [Spiroplasma poulsonii]PQM30470.1 putative aminopeptidase YsdC [Spiroplasma poulsonii]PWF95438.1 Putative aminopeptidase YsdC [Spiroplasma poulsonii]
MKITNEKKIMYENILQAFGPSGCEEQVVILMKQYYQKYTSEIIQDNLGSCFAVIRNQTGIKNAKKVMLMAHGDEVGFMVSQINEKGLIRINPLGGIWEQTLLAKRVRLLKDDGTFIIGAISAIAPHLLSPEARSKPTPIANMLVDFGFTSKAEAYAAGVREGNFVICEGPTVFLNDKRLLSKAIDNRMGLILGLEVLEQIKDKALDFDLYVGFSAQEEVGTRGAATATALIKPDFAIVTDVSPGQDYESTSTFGQLGQGVMLRGMDNGYVTRHDLIKYQLDLMQQHQIKYQFYISPGGTDAGRVHLADYGIPTIQACLIARNLHTISGIIDLDDFNETIKLVTTIIEDLDEIKIKNFNWSEKR